MLTKMLIANRDEIAVRITNAYRELAICSVAVFSETGRYTLHVEKAHETSCLDEGPLITYLNPQLPVKNITTPMPGNVIEALVKEDEKVTMSTLLSITETIKMETENKVPVTGTVSSVYVQKEDRITPGETLIQIKE